MNILTKYIIIGILILVALGTVGWIFYAGLIRPTTKPNPSTIQQGQNDNYNFSITPHQTFGCMFLPAQKFKEK